MFMVQLPYVIWCCIFKKAKKGWELQRIWGEARIFNDTGLILVFLMEIVWEWELRVEYCAKIKIWRFQLSILRLSFFFHLNLAWSFSNCLIFHCCSGIVAAQPPPPLPPAFKVPSAPPAKPRQNSASRMASDVTMSVVPEVSTASTAN